MASKFWIGVLLVSMYHAFWYFRLHSCSNSRFFELAEGDFGGDAGGEELMWNQIFSTLNATTETFVDIGAGQYDDKADQSLAVAFAKHTNCAADVRVFGIEPQESVVLETTEKTQSSQFACLHWVTKAVSNESGEMSFFGKEGCRNLKSLVLSHWHGDWHGFAPECRGKPVKHDRVQVTTLDEFSKSNGINRLDFLKVDTEGNDFQVLLGAHRLLKEGLIDLISIEFSSTWNSYYQDIWGSDWSGKPHSPEAITSFPGPSLQRVVQLMGDFGYQSFVVGNVMRSGSPVLLPIGGHQWEAKYDLCLRRFCFMNIVFATSRGSEYIRSFVRPEPPAYWWSTRL
eukprot:gnl/TRDRNA2_/TRDRNA2_164759_c0_seq1.p1 gnl/TRDRNA2_/TRDRNA2_164759_c0~~gnl/TRDRNA2_/TRDRNA2_164759_c0_seq1.p1  ORF type:complete len:341 (-),score=39.84 gnl/TRDRNA2_/TRDRNA2_164759_c0_seq1:30-1052(-)